MSSVLRLRQAEQRASNPFLLVRRQACGSDELLDCQWSRGGNDLSPFRRPRADDRGGGGGTGLSEVVLDIERHGVLVARRDDGDRVRRYAPLVQEGAQHGGRNRVRVGTDDGMPP